MYVSLTLKQAQKLKSLARKQKKSESEVLRHVLDAYLNSVETRDLPFEPYRKISPFGMKVLPRTVIINQDRKLREITEKTGRRISELAREAVEDF